MSDYRLEYTCLTYILMLYDEEEEWERILIDCDFDYHRAIKALILKLQRIVIEKVKNEDTEGLEFYSIALDKAKNIYD